MKKLALIIFTILILLTATACKNEEPEPSLSPSFSYNYATFEQMLDLATDIIKGKCLEIIETDNSRDFEFEIKERYLGEESNSTILVSEYDLLLMGPNDPPILYEEGKEYFLVLQKKIGVLREKDDYFSVHPDLLIPIDNIEQSTVWGDSILQHSQMESCNNAQEFEDYIVHYLNEVSTIENRPLYYGKKYITATDMETIITKSPIIVQIKIKELDNESLSTYKWICTVQSVLKGNVTEKSEIKVVLLKDSVQIGKEYIIALDASDGSYDLAAKNGIYNISEYDKIMEYISE